MNRDYMKGDKNPSKRIDVRLKISSALKGNKWNVGKKHSEESKIKRSIALKGRKITWGDKISKALKGRKTNFNSSEKAYQRILDEIPELEKQGFKCIPIGKVIPDIIAIKNGKVFAIEVERRNPNYSKYDDKIKIYYDNIIWILRKKHD